MIQIDLLENKMLNSLFILLSATADVVDFSHTRSYNYVNDFVNMLLSLGAVIAVLFGVLWVLKKMMRSRLSYLNETSAIRVLEKRILNQKAALYLIEVLGKGILISESTAGIQMVSTIEGKEWEEELATLNQPEPSYEEEGATWWKRLTSRHA
jgi:flagellar biogenesis protein FliO